MMYVDDDLRMGLGWDLALWLARWLLNESIIKHEIDLRDGLVLTLASV